MKFLISLTMLALAACAGTKAAYQAAETPDEYAFVLAAHYASLVEQAAALRERPTTPPEAVAAMQRADTAAAPVVDRLRPLADAYKAVQSAENQAALQKAIDESVRLIADLIRAVRSAGGGAANLLDDRILSDAEGVAT